VNVYSTMVLGCSQVFYGGLRQNLYHLQVYSSVPHVNRGETGKMRVDPPDSEWIHLKVGIQSALFLAGLLCLRTNCFK